MTEKVKKKQYLFKEKKVLVINMKKNPGGLNFGKITTFHKDFTISFWFNKFENTNQIFLSQGKSLKSRWYLGIIGIFLFKK
jgi:hypothetical protein